MKCKHCKEEKRVSIKWRYLGRKFVHECPCGIKLCTDILGRNELQQSAKDKEGEDVSD